MYIVITDGSLRDIQDLAHTLCSTGRTDGECQCIGASRCIGVTDFYTFCLCAVAKVPAIGEVLAATGGAKGCARIQRKRLTDPGLSDVADSGDGGF